MSVLSGKLGAVNAVDTVRSWRISTSAALQAFIASNTNGMSGQAEGNVDWVGQYAAYGHTPLKMPGDTFTFTGSCDGAKGCFGPAIVDSAEVVIDIETGAVIAHTVNFSGTGALTLGAAVVADSEVPAIFSSIQRKVEMSAIAGAVAYTELAHIRTVTLRFSAANTAYVDSSTSGHVSREAGNLTVGLSLSVYEASGDLANLAAVLPNTWKKVRVYVTATEYWEFNACVFENATDFVIDREAATICGFTIGARFSGIYNDGTGLVIGSIVDPAESQWWPVGD